MIYNNLSYKNQMEVDEGMEWINKMVVDGEYLDAINGLTELMGMFEEDITFHKLVSNLRDTAKDLWKEQLYAEREKTVVMCVRCACNMTAEERNRDYTIGKGAYVCDKCLDDEEEYCFQQHLLVSGIKCRKCDVYLEPHTQDEHLDINHKVHTCEGGHKR